MPIKTRPPPFSKNNPTEIRMRGEKKKWLGK